MKRFFLLLLIFSSNYIVAYNKLDDSTFSIGGEFISIGGSFAPNRHSTCIFAFNTQCNKFEYGFFSSLNTGRYSSYYADASLHFTGTFNFNIGYLPVKQDRYHLSVGIYAGWASRYKDVKGRCLYGNHDSPKYCPVWITTTDADAFNCGIYTRNIIWFPIHMDHIPYGLAVSENDRLYYGISLTVGCGVYDGFIFTLGIPFMQKYY